MTTVDEAATLASPRPSLLRRLRWPLMIGGPLLILAVALYFVLTSGRFESTDDAYVQAGKAPVSPSIAGRVIEVDVKENQTVKAGQVLFKLDPADLQASLRDADATLAAARAQVSSLGAVYQQQRVAVATAERTAVYAAKEAARQQSLVAAGVASQQQASEAAHAADMARQQVATARQMLAEAAANLGGGGGSNPAIMQAEARLATVRLNLQHTIIVASQDGVATRVEQLQPGTYLNASQTAFWLISGDPWVDANFKENQLGKMRIGEPADIEIDAYGSKKFKGHVASFSPATGSALSPLPAQNATGNWVKVVQRLPVRIAFDQPPPDLAGRAGLSAKVTVDIRGQKHDGR